MYHQKLEEQELQRKQAEEDKKNNSQGGNGENMEEEEGHQPELTEEEKIELTPFNKTEKKLVMSLDTLGQDRVFNESEINYIFVIVKTIIKAWEDLEERLLLRDRDLRIQMMKLEKPFKDSVCFNFLITFLV